MYVSAGIVMFGQGLPCLVCRICFSVCGICEWVPPRDLFQWSCGTIAALTFRFHKGGAQKMTLYGMFLVFFGNLLGKLQPVGCVLIQVADVQFV